MSWDIVIFSSKQKIRAVEEVDEELLVAIDFNIILEKHFINIIANKNNREIKGEGYIIDYFFDSEPVSNKVFSLYGEEALFVLINVAKLYDWQIFDTGNGEMLDLEHPEKNGYSNFQSYLQHVLKNTGN
ncbi:hypothetical protein H9N25_16815 [Pedobacter riviphilus]|uniref:Uncharacterized protein n=1 Tax=Pedobacter riviphilus TaxID=2766984 RepID=A0ABX6TGT6_9SPHI|nr:hypothetical protein [Pedobacter riviphilus]QNR83600.1 hypothetical protein H9N25_16815 [Pedobacter riviphilus]